MEKGDNSDIGHERKTAYYDPLHTTDTINSVIKFSVEAMLMWCNNDRNLSIIWQLT